MYKWSGRVFLFSVLTIPLLSYATINPANLIKVTPETDPSCVEYYTYKNAMYCSTKALQSEKVDPNIKNYEHQTIAFDDRPWFAAWGQHTPAIDTVEYVPAGDNINKWTELVTSQFMPDPENKYTPKQFVDLFMQSLKETGLSPEIHYWKETPNQILFEFQIHSPANQAQDELQIVTRGPKGLYILHYAVKKADMGKANRDKWIALLEKSHF